MTILTLKTTIGRESTVMKDINERVRSSGHDIKAIVHPEELDGYVILEGDATDIRKVVRDVRHAKGIISEDVGIDEINQFLESKEIEIEVERDDIVEVIGGPFKGEKGKITRVDEANSEVTLELLEATVPIPVTVGVGSVKIVESSGESE
ncbi:MAG: transcription elongation factor Spt5 [Candidatus Aenigmatarchaeota archaeon]